MTKDEYEHCRNCGGRKCMACVLLEVHGVCVDDCPKCCNVELFDVEEVRPVRESNAYSF